MSELDERPFYRHLDYSWNYRGLTLVHIFAIFLVTVVSALVCQLVSISPLYGVAPAVATTIGLLALQYRRPQHYVEDLVIAAFSPKSLSHAIDDTTTCEFPVPREHLRRR